MSNQTTPREVKKVSLDKAGKIIGTRKPLGRFYTIDNSIRLGKCYIGIDNSHGDAWTEEFTNLRSCKRWLTGK